MWYNSIMKWILRSPLHGLISKHIMLITFTGRKSGKPYTTPVNYVRDGDALTVVSYRRRTWWRNLRGGAPVTVRMQGQELKAGGEVIEDDEGVAANLFAYLPQVPNYARYFRVALDPRRSAQPRRCHSSCPGQSHSPNQVDLTHTATRSDPGLLQSRLTH